MTAHANLGAQKLLAVAESHAEIARQCGVSRNLPAFWRKSQRLPSTKARAALSRLYGIGIDEWKLPAVAAPTASSPRKKAAPPNPRTAAHRAPDPLAPTGPPPYPTPPKDPTVLEHARHSLACLRHDMQYRSLIFGEVLKVRADELKLITAISKMQSAQELSESRYVTEHPAWVDLKRRILRALVPFPEAASAVAKALEPKA